MKKEIWNDIPNYEGKYQASNLGRIKSITRKVKHCKGGLQTLNARILKHHINKTGYCTVAVSLNGKERTVTVHRLVMFAFYGISNLHVDHINSIKHDNRIENLRYCTARENLSFYKREKPTGLPTGVYVCNKKWRARIRYNGKLNHIGTFDTIKEAEHAYNEVLSLITNK